MLLIAWLGSGLSAVLRPSLEGWLLGSAQAHRRVKDCRMARGRKAYHTSIERPIHPIVGRSVRCSVDLGRSGIGNGIVNLSA